VRPRILVISFSPIHSDARVLRQLSVLAEAGEVTTLGYGPQPASATEHLEVATGIPSLPETPMGVLRLALRLHRSLPLTTPGERAGMRLLADHEPFDLVVANDARALPLALFAARGAPVWADLHEWAPEENTTSLPWRLLVKPYMDALCRRFLPRVAAASTVSASIAELYRDRYGVTPAVVRNAGPYRALSPSAPVPGRVRLVHSGVAIPERNIEGLIDAVGQLGERFTLDLYLIGTEQYLESLRRRAADVGGVTIHPPTTPAELPATLNRYDLGVYILPLRTLNHRLMLPNKFFDFVQARLGIVMSPALETARLIETHDLGPRLGADTREALVQTLAAITDSDVARYKESADRAAQELNSAADIETMQTLVARLLNTPPAHHSSPVRVVIASRIFTPEPAAASFMLEAIARKLVEAGHEVTVLTTKAPRGTEVHDPVGVEVRRARVRRDRSGYVRGYLSYLSFDIPLFFRLLVGRRADIYLVEPPPTTGAVVRIAAWLRRRPYVYEAADLWADAARMVTGNRFVLGALRRVEGFGMRGARRLFAISSGLVGRVRELGITTPATVVGFGADPAFRYEPTVAPPPAQDQYFIYAGSYSEWHGADIFVKAFARIREEHSGTRLVFIGHGSERDELIAWCEANEVTGVEFREPVEPEALNPLLGGALAALASVRPGTGYDYAFATKVYASTAAGCPVIFSGAGPTSEFIAAAALGAGVAVDYDVEAVTDAMRRALSDPLPPADREKLSAWARHEHSIDACAELVAREIASTAHP
jgi:glycosyltransferase involved in cell wall biosynthesis